MEGGGRCCVYCRCYSGVWAFFLGRGEFLCFSVFFFSHSVSGWRFGIWGNRWGGVDFDTDIEFLISSLAEVGIHSCLLMLLWFCDFLFVLLYSILTFTCYKANKRSVV
jgi:hypothetical protein